MKVLCVDYPFIGGHGPSYREALDIEGNQSVYVFSEEVEPLRGKVYTIPRKIYAREFRKKHKQLSRLLSPFLKFINMFYGLEFMHDTRNIADKENVDIVHFASADFMRWSYLIPSLYMFKNYKVVLTFHRIETSTGWRFYLNYVAGKVAAVTSHVMGREKIFSPSNRSKYQFIPYPSAMGRYRFTTSEAREFLNIHTDLKIIAFVGGMRSEKGVVCLLEALKNLRSPFYLIFAGDKGSYSEEFLVEKLSQINAPKTVMIKYLSDEEFVACVAASDIIAVPYSKSFMGTSGPMTEGIRFRKTIVGCDHSNIGEYIRNYGIGYSCEADNPAELVKALEKALHNPIEYTFKMEELVRMQGLDEFRRRISKIYRDALRE